MSAFAAYQLLKQRQISQIKTDFINNMTHELKTPITSIKGYVQIMQRMYNKSGDGFLKGFTNNYVAVLFDGPDNLQGSETHVRLLSLQGDTVLGERAKNHEN